MIYLKALSQDALNASYKLPDEELKHLLVLRKQVGDKVTVSNGKGLFGYAFISKLEKRKGEIEFRKSEPLQYTKNPHRVKVFIAPTKSQDKMEWMVEKLTEIGVLSIHFFISRYSERKKLRLDRLEAKAIGAMKQSNQIHLPLLSFDETFSIYDQKKEENHTHYIAYVPQDPAKHLFYSIIDSPIHCLWIGPEGGFHQEEVSHIKSIEGKICSLGNNRLRTETAALVACQTINLALLKK